MASNRMNVQLVLKSPHTVFTNLDFIQGHVVLNLQNPMNISNIVVKLEGESRTRLLGMGNPDLGERPKARDELHKVLYQTKTVFPDVAIKNSVTVPPGHYEYPFEFKIPFNNTCESSSDSGLPSISSLPGILGAVAREARPQQQPMRHRKATLPPSLTTFPGMAEIRYYLKVTVGRKEFFKENPRVIQTFNFLPIEPPRLPYTTAEAYAKRKHTFTSNPSNQRLKKAFNPFKSQDSKSQDSGEAPEIALDARLPNPPIITCHETIPLRLLVKRLNSSSEPLYLTSLQIALVGYTHIRAHDTVRNETSSWVVMSRSNMSYALPSPQQRQPSSSSADNKSRTDPVDKKKSPSSTPSQSSNSESGKKKPPVEGGEISIEPSLWDIRIPNSVAPSFDTCNITRKYDLEIVAGIGCGSNFKKNSTILPLRLPIQIYSGIHPPPALLEAMSANPSDRPSVSKKPLSAAAISNVTAANAAKAHEASSSSTPSASTPSASSSMTPAVSARPTRRPVYRPPVEDDKEGEEPPPSYEDAIASELGPIDGPRNYQPAPVPAGAGGFEASDEKNPRRSSDS